MRLLKRNIWIGNLVGYFLNSPVLFSEGAFEVTLTSKPMYKQILQKRQTPLNSFFGSILYLLSERIYFKTFTAIGIYRPK